MGCNLKDLAPAHPISMEALSGSRVGVDAFLLAFQFLTTIRDLGPTGDGGPLKDDHGRPVAHLMGFLARSTGLVEAGIAPVFIFDGAHPDLKADEMADRRARREAAESAWQAALDAGDYATAQKLGPRVVRYTPEMVEETMELLRLLGIPALRAAAEGEAQAAMMARRGDLDVVATQDWDALLYGAPVVVRHLTSHGTKRYGRIIRAERIDLAEVLATNDLTQEQLVDLGIMIGTDFHPGIRGIGPKTGLKLIKKHGHIEAICEVKGIEPPTDLDLIRRIFHDHPAVETPPTQLVQGTVDEAGLRRFLIEERSFSERRVQATLDVMERAGRARGDGQSSLFDF